MRHCAMRHCAVQGLLLTVMQAVGSTRAAPSAGELDGQVRALQDAMARSSMQRRDLGRAIAGITAALVPGSSAGQQ